MTEKDQCRNLLPIGMIKSLVIRTPDKLLCLTLKRKLSFFQGWSGGKMKIPVLEAEI
eukprot:CAMPEP_0185772278 /NCGR_PEP_ID=MMETSP1174-20130828/68115_1 /TAXON_ID=35687 /ORGANISM="Dictyocha speculum, Strain CCMP1381" /LENGTH=56 /DNA_ID=CAMNT_0028458467 /DNA_START=105 /DNA_END=275 /DNA_ORIENTATION=-